MSEGANPSPKPSTPLRSVRTLLIWLVLACLLPGVVGAAVLFFHQYQVGRAQLENNTLQTARALVQTVDAQLVQTELLAQTLASSDSLARKDFAAFHQRAQKLLQESGSAQSILIYDVDGQQWVNTRLPFGQPLPKRSNLVQIERVFATGKPVTSEVFLSPLTGLPVVSVVAPVFSGTKVVFALGIGIAPQQLQRKLIQQNLPPDWVVGVFDDAGTVAARTHSPEQFVGHKGAPELVRHMLAAPEGVLEVTTLEGIPTLAVYSRSPLTHWSVAIAIPRQNLETALMRTIATLGLGIAMLFAMGLGLAWYMGGRIARSVNALTAPAVALEAGEAVVVPLVHFREADEVAQAMAGTARLLVQRNRKLKDAHTQLLDSEERYQTMVEQSPEAIVVHQDGKLLYVNPTGIKMFGVNSAQDLIGRPILSLVHPDHHQTLPERLKSNAEQGGLAPMIEMSLIRLDGTPVVVEVQGTSIVYNGKPAFQASIRDITGRKKAEDAQRLAALLFANIQDGAVVTDPSGTVLAINPAFTAINGYTEADIIGGNMRRLQSGRHDAAFYQQMWHTILTTGGWQGEIWDRRMNGEIYLEQLSIQAVHDSSGALINYVGTFSDLTGIKHADHMEYLALHDLLTGLPNRMLLMSRLGARHGGQQTPL